MDTMTGAGAGTTQDVGTGAGASSYGGGVQTGTTPAAGAQQPLGGTSGAQQTAAGVSWNPPANSKWAGKSPDDVLRSYEELEKKLGAQGDELGKWKSFWSQWDPIAKQVGYNPQALAAALQRQAQAADQRGDHQQAQNLRAQAQQAKWADQLHPDDQEKWLNQTMEQRLQSTIGPLQQQVAQRFQQMESAGVDYINRYMDLGIRALAAKIENPKLDLNQLLEQAVNIASGKYDPLDWSKQIMLAETPQAIEARLRKQIEAEYAQKQRNQAATAGVGAVAGGGTSRAIKPRPPAATQQAPARPDYDANRIAARESFVNRMVQQHGAEG